MYVNRKPVERGQGRGALTDFEGGHELTDGDHQEEEVVEELELVEQHNGDQGQHIVFLIVQAVRREAAGPGLPVHLDHSLLLGNHPPEAPPERVAGGDALGLRLLTLQ